MISDSRKSQFLTDENIKLIQAQVSEICLFYKQKYKFDIVKGKYVKNALIKTIRHYTAYLKAFDCKVSSVDFYKIYSWFPYFLSEELHTKDLQYGVLKVALWRMCEEIGCNTPAFNDYLEKLIALIQNELDKNADFGIGKNGLYMCVKLASIQK